MEENKMNSEVLQKYNKTKYIKLILAIIIDLVGFISYIFPAIGESLDFVWAPISGLLIFILFPHRKLIALGGAAEEFLPFTDFIPTAVIAWTLDYVKDYKNTQAEFAKRFENRRVYD